MKPSYLIIFENNNSEYGFAYDNGFCGSENKRKALNMICDDMNEYHVAGGTWSASAALDYISCRKHVVEIKGGLEEVKNLLVGDNTLYKF